MRVCRKVSDLCVFRSKKYAAMSVDRQGIDLKIGVAFSRLITRSLNMLKEKFRLRDQKMISFGPCQTSSLWFCVQRHNLRPVEFLPVTMNVAGKVLAFCYADRDMVTSRQEMKRWEAMVKQTNTQQGAVIGFLTEEKGSVKRPFGLKTVTLVRVCSKGLGMSHTAAMMTAEHLYTFGYSSYLRIETTAYPPAFDLHSTLEEQANDTRWGSLVSYQICSGGTDRPEGEKDVGDNPDPLITLTGAAARDKIRKENERKIYDYVTRHFIARLHDYCEYQERKMVVDLCVITLLYTWHKMVDRGSLFAMPWKMKGMALNEANLPGRQLREGLPINIRGFNTVTEYTKSPDYLQESDLITLMDKHGIGTDASIPQVTRTNFQLHSFCL